MGEGIYLIQGGGELVEMTEQAYDSESLLQGLLEKYPSLLAGKQIDSARPRRWLLVCREAGVPCEEDAADRWSVDHLFLDQDGIPTLVEVKRSSDTRIRREVVGQMLDYAANAVLYWPVEAIRSRFLARCEEVAKDPEAELDGLLAGELEVEQFWTQVKTNLQAGKIRMLFVADEIPAELRRIVEFLNQQMEFAEVLAVEIKQFSGQGLRTLVPRVMGQTVESQRAKSGGATAGRDWDEDSYLAEMEARKGVEAAALAKRLLAWAKPRASGIYFGRGTQSGTFLPFVTHDSQDYGLFQFRTHGRLHMLFMFLRKKKPFTAEERLRELVSKLNQIPGVLIPENDLHGMPQIPLKPLQTEAGFTAFTQVMEWLITQIQTR